MKKEYEILYNDLKGKETVNDIYNLLKILNNIYYNSLSDNTILGTNNFLNYLLNQNKISNRLFNVIKYNDEYLIDPNVDKIIELLYNNIFELTIGKLSSDEKLDYLYYLLALYIFEHEDEKKYFINEYLPEVIDDMDIYDYDFFEKLTINEFPYELYDNFKMYYFIQKFSHLKSKEKQTEEQITEDNDIIEAESTKNRLNC